jgi:tetratricopeptide (TPR) repeat protein
MPHFELDKYHPSQSIPPELSADSIVCEETATKIAGDILDQINDGVTRHYLVIGARGSGKTSVLRLLSNRMANDPVLSAALFPIVFSEEEYSVLAFQDFVIKILEILSRTAHDDTASTAYHNLLVETDDEAAIDGALGFLQDYAVEAKKRLVLIMDNYEQFIQSQAKNDVFRKRMKELLSKSCFIVIAGAAPTAARKAGNKSDSLRELFNCYFLEELDVEQAEYFLSRRAILDGNEEITRKIPMMKGKLKTLRYLIGGTPRLLTMLYRQLTLHPTGDILQILLSLVDDLTPEYKHKFEWLSPQARKVLDAIARASQTVTPTEIARSCRLPVNQVTSTLNRLLKSGYITTAKQAKRKATYYLLSDRLFRLWHHVRYDPVNRQGVIDLVEFLSFWYDHAESINKMALVEYHCHFFHTAGKLYDALRMLEYSSYRFEDLPENGLAGSFFNAQVMNYLWSEQWDLAGEELNRLLDEQLATNEKEKAGAAYYALALFHHQCGLREFTEEHFLKALKSYARSAFSFPDEAEVCNNWACALTNLARLKGDESLYQEAFRKFEQAISIRPDFYEAWGNWGNSLAAFARIKRDDALFGETFAKYQRVAEIKPEEPDALNNWGNTLTALARLKRDEVLFREAFFKYQQATHLKPDMHDAFYNWGTSLVSLARIKKDADLFQEAAAKFKQAVRIEPGFHEALNNWGNALAAQAQLTGEVSLIQSAGTKYQQALGAKPNKPEVFFNWGMMLAEQANRVGDENLLSEAFENLRQAAAIRPDLYYAFAEMGFIKTRKGDFDQALRFFERAFPVAQRMRDQEASAALSRNILQVLKRLIVREVFAQNNGQAEKLFDSFLSYKNVAGKQEWVEALLGLFAAFFSKSRTEIYFKMEEMLREKGGHEQVRLLRPISKAYEFWRSGENPEILDRLNPEVREIVEEILTIADGTASPSPATENAAE